MNLEVGSVLTGKVTGIAKFGAFVLLSSGQSGLVHISEVANTYVNNVEDYLSVGQEVTVKVISIDDGKKINLSIKQALPDYKKDGEPRQRRNDNRQSGDNNSRGRSFQRDSYRPRRPQQDRNVQAAEVEKPKSDNQSFEDTLKKFLQESDAKISESGRYDRQRSTRRRNGGK